MKNMTDAFVTQLYALSQQQFDHKTIEEAKKCLLDYLAVTFAGAKLCYKKSKSALANFNEVGSSPVIGLNQKVGISNAILFNGIHSHVIELDDGHRHGMMHPGSPILSSLIPLAQKNNIEGNKILKALIVGYEAAIQLARAIQPNLKLRGFHGTGITGSIGASVAIAVALDFNKIQLKNAISAAATSASGVLKVIKDSSELKPYNAGNAALSGYNSALLAYSGFKGPLDVLGGTLGFLSMMGGSEAKHPICNNEKDSLAIHSIYRKPYAACRHCHAPIEASLLLSKAQNINIDRIEKIKVKTYSLAVAGHDHTEIEGINSAKMSTPYSVAVALVNNSANMEDFSESMIKNKKILNLAEKVETLSIDELSQLVPEKRAAILEIYFKNGQHIQQRVDYPKGEPENPMTTEELHHKFQSLSQFAGKSDNEIKNIMEIIENFGKDYNTLYRYL